MARAVGDRPVEFLWDVRTHLWVGAVLFFVLGDVVTTSVGLRMERIVEVGPLVGTLIERYGVAAMVALKAGVCGGCYALYRVAPRPQTVGIPLGLATLGALVTGWNLAVLAVALVL